jgi:hypothetical protein
VGADPDPCALISERTEEIAGKNEEAVGDCINDDNTASADGSFGGGRSLDQRRQAQ